MLSDLRFVIGAVMAIAMLAIGAFGIGVSVRLAREAKMGPIETSRRLAYADHGDWNQFYDAAGLRQAEETLRKSQTEREPTLPAAQLPEAVVPAPELIPAPVLLPAPELMPAPVLLPAREPDNPVAVAAPATNPAAVPEPPPEPALPRSNVASAEPPIALAAVAGEATALETSNVGAPVGIPPEGAGVVAGVVEEVPAGVIEEGAGGVIEEVAAGVMEEVAVEQKTEETAAIPGIPDDKEQAPADRNEVGSISPVPLEFEPEQGTQPPAAPVSRKRYRAAPKPKSVAKEPAATKEKNTTHGPTIQSKTAVKIKIAPKAQPVRTKVARIRGSRVRALRTRMLVALPHASTGYAIVVPRVTRRAKNRRISASF